MTFYCLGSGPSAAGTKARDQLLLFLRNILEMWDKNLSYAEQQTSAAVPNSSSPGFPALRLPSPLWSVTEQMDIDPQCPPAVTFEGTGDVWPGSLIYQYLGNRKTRVTSNPSTGDRS